MKYKVIAVTVLVLLTAISYSHQNGLLDRLDSDRHETMPAESREEQGSIGQTAAEGGPAAEASLIVVDVDGAVNKPGVIEIAADSRVHQAVEKAGGLKKTADTSNINMAAVLTDGEKVFVPDKSESVRGSADVSAGRQRININTADAATLQQLAGIGPATAEKIIAHRDLYGRFKKPEDIKNVSGIGEKTFEKFKAQICVN